jgi:hypothetical protein
MREGSEIENSTETKQSEAWRGEFGTEYSERNLLDPPALDASYQRKYGGDPIRPQPPVFGGYPKNRIDP